MRINKLYFFVFVIILSVFPFRLKAQTSIESFTPDSIAYFEEMGKFLASARKDEAKAFMKKFKVSWYGGKYSKKQRDGVYKITNLMLSSGMLPFPDFVNYLNSVSSFVTSKYQTQASFQSWQSIVEKLIKKKGRHARQVFSAYLQVSNSLFTSNMMYSSASKQWIGSNSHYIFGYDSLPKMTFQKTTLTCYAKNDSIKIFNTQGVYYPTTNIWIGKGGYVTWTRAGFPSDTVYANLKNYVINMKYDHYDADSVTLFDKFFFTQPLRGRLQDRVVANVTPQTATYPKFYSYSKRLKIKNITDSVDYEGGFVLNGRKILGSGTKNNPAQLKFYRKDTLFLLAQAKSFAIEPTSVRSTECAVTFYLDTDSITQPGLNFKLLIKKREVVLYRDGKGLSGVPYSDTYHQLDMDIQELVWPLDKPKITFTYTTADTRAIFNSFNFFNVKRYNQIEGMNQVHPLIQIRDLYKKTHKMTMPLMALAEEMHYTLNETKLFLEQMAVYGYVSYNSNTNEFTIKKRLFHDIFARVGKVDYDNLQFVSDPKKGVTDGSLSLVNYDMDLNGVSHVLLSDSQRVVVVPDSGKLEIRKNRDFVFNGVVIAGKFMFYGSKYKFHYNAFKIDLNDVDSVRLFATGTKKDKYGNPVLIPVKTLIQDVRGNLLIDDPRNKSGVKPYTKYPIFHSFDNSYVYYDKKSVQNGAYKKNKFYFQIFPFTIDSLNDYANNQLKFNGKLVSAGILPTFDDQLKLQPDYSLGLTKKTPPGGMPLYGGKGRVYNKIDLSNEGLKSDGKITYLTSTSYSHSFYLLPDSVFGKAYDFKIKAQQAGIEYPPTRGTDVDIKWLPHKDTLLTTTLAKPLAMYDGSTLSGKTILTPGGLDGSGKFSFQRAELTSNLYKFKYQTFSSDTADFKLKNENDSSILNFATTDMKTFIDFKHRYGKFKSNGGGSVIKFPRNKYIAYMEEFKWFMDNSNIELTGKPQTSQANASGLKLQGSQFISVDPKQDSLSFYSSKALYDIKKSIIYAQHVKFFQVADAMIYPDSEKVTVENNAKMRPLVNAKIVTSFITQYHHIYKANLTVASKEKYEGSGYIDYAENNGKKEPIFLEKIAVDTTGQTYASGAILPKDSFMLSPHYHYEGRVQMLSNNQFLTFRGYAKIIQDCNKLNTEQIAFTSTINPKDIYIPIDTNMANKQGKRIYASILLSSTSGLYSAFASPLKVKTDKMVLPSSGFLHYNGKTKKYEIANKLKIVDQSYPGQYIALGTDNCKVYGEGNINVGVDLGSVQLTTAGKIIQNEIDNSAILDVIMGINFYFSDNAMDVLTKAIQDKTSLKPLDYNRDNYKIALQAIVGKKEADEMISQIALNGQAKKIPKALRNTITFSDLKMRWDAKINSYLSFGKLGISSIGKTQISKYVDGIVQIKQQRGGNTLNIYLEIDPNNWYFFSYQRGVMQSISSDNDYNNILMMTKSKDAKLHKKNAPPYEYMYSNLRKESDFMRSLGK